MLYEQWCRLAGENSTNLAMHCLSTGRTWTFQELWDEAERHPVATHRVLHSGARFPEFIFEVIAAWKHQKVLCPLEIGQTPVEFPELPPSIIHCKITSGTSGARKVALFTESQLLADVDNIVATMGLRVGAPNIGVISMAHSYGFSNLVLPLLLHGIPLIHVGNPFPEAVKSAARLHKKVTLAAVPAMWKAWVESGCVPKNLSLAISAGAPLPLVLERKIFEETGVKIHNFYGSSECGGIAFDVTKVPRSSADILGDAMQGVKLSKNEDGCLVVESNAVGEGYWPTFFEGFGKGRFKTADLVNLDGSKVIFQGRNSDIINVAGRKVSPERIEECILQQPRVRECMVFGIPSGDSARGDLMVAVVVGSVTEVELKAQLLSQLESWQLPREWVFVENLAVNSRGKLSRAEWRAKYLENSKAR